MIDYGYGVMLGDIPEQAREWRNKMNLLAHTRESDWIHPKQQELWYEKIQIDLNNRMYGIWLSKKSEDDLSNCINPECYSCNGRPIPIGVCGLTNMRPPHRVGEWSLYIAYEYQGEGYATKALKTLVHHGFMALDLRKIWGEIMLQNEPSKRLSEKLGFKQEGQIRKAYYKNGEYVDTIIVGLLKEEWEEERRNRV